MKIKIASFALLASSFIYAQTLTTQPRDNAGLSTDQSGFYQTQNPQNFPTGASSWWGLIDLRHNQSTGTNNYGIQIAGSFYNQELYLRKNNNNNSQQWSKFVLENPSGRVGIGIPNPESKLDIGTDNTQKTFINYQNKSSITFIPNTGDWFHISHGSDHELAISQGASVDQTRLVTITSGGNMSVNGKVEAKEIRVTLTPTADFVFEENYELPKLKDVEKFIKENKHLPEVASAKVMEKEGVNVGEFQIKLLQKIEELTLYVIDQQKKIETLENKLSDKK